MGKKKEDTDAPAELSMDNIQFDGEQPAPKQGVPAAAEDAMVYDTGPVDVELADPDTEEVDEDDEGDGEDHHDAEDPDVATLSDVPAVEQEEAE